jgi:hypothetical protein
MGIGNQWEAKSEEYSTKSMTIGFIITGNSVLTSNGLNIRRINSHGLS